MKRPWIYGSRNRAVRTPRPRSHAELGPASCKPAGRRAKWISITLYLKLAFRRPPRIDTLGNNLGQFLQSRKKLHSIHLLVRDLSQRFIVPLQSYITHSRNNLPSVPEQPQIIPNLPTKFTYNDM